MSISSAVSTEGSWTSRRDTHSRFQRSWSKEEDAILTERYPKEGKSRELEIALGRSKGAIEKRVTRLGILIDRKFVRSRLLKNLKGQAFGDLKVLEYAETNDGHAYWHCQCQCEALTIVKGEYLLNGDTQSCGCRRGEKSFFEQGVHSRYLKKLIRQAKIRGIEFDLSLKYIGDLFTKQDQRCMFSNVPLAFGRRQIQTASLDRIDSTKGYIEGNVQWVHKRINAMKNNMTDAEFVKWCSSVAKHCVDSIIQ